MSNKIFKCPICNQSFMDKEGLYDHVEKDHRDEIPENMSVKQYVFNLKNKKSGGTCVIDKKPTKWNETAERYDRFCSDKCKAEYIRIFQERMKKVHGVTHTTKLPEQQQKMQDNRSISGTYKFNSDGIIVNHMGSYELDFLKYIDNELCIDGSELMKCPHYFEYVHEGQTRIYMPDFFFPNFNLIVEIKDGGSNPNMHHKIQSVDKVKETLKDTVMKSQRNFNYIKIVNKQYNSFLYLINLIKDTSFDDPDFSKKFEALIFIP